MRRSSLAVALALSAAVNGTSWSDEPRDFCADRPGKATPSCTLDPGRIQLEVSGVDWTRDDEAGTRTDTTLVGDFLVRFGVTDYVEGRVGWTPYGRVETHDASGRSSDDGIGDLSLGFRANLLNPDGSGTSFALQPTLTLPTGGHASGGGTWSAGLVAPLSLELADQVQLAISPEVDAAADGDRSGRHFAYGAVVGLGFPVIDQVTGSLELAGIADRDPDGHTVQWTADAAVAWQPPSLNDVQFDLGAYVGLNRQTPDLELYAGIAKRF